MKNGDFPQLCSFTRGYIYIYVYVYVYVYIYTHCFTIFDVIICCNYHVSCIYYVVM